MPLHDTHCKHVAWMHFCNNAVFIVMQQGAYHAVGEQLSLACHVTSVQHPSSFCLTHQHKPCWPFQLKGMTQSLRRCHIGGLCGGALAAYLLGPSYVSTSQTGCMQTCIDTPPVATLARKGTQRHMARCKCLKCAINQTGIRMSKRTKFKCRVLLHNASIRLGVQ